MIQSLQGENTMNVHAGRQRRQVFFRLLCLTVLALAAPAQAQQVPATGGPMQPPRYPPELAASGAEGTTMLLLTQDAGGKVIKAEVEESSGYAAFDQAAIDAALTWKLQPMGEAGKPGRVRVPVAFKNPGLSADGAGGENDVVDVETRRHWQVLWQQMQVAPIAAARDGTLPGYLPDPLPMPAATAAEVLALLEANAEREDDVEGGPLRYTWKDIPLITHYEVFDASWSNNLTVLRSRLVTDGKQAFWMQRFLCDAPNPAECATFEAQLRKTPRQPSLAPPPPPPPPPKQELEQPAAQSPAAG